MTATKGKPLPFRRIYFDTSALREAGWPHVSARLEQLLSLARHLTVRAFLPEPVARELEEHWLREFDEKMARVKLNAAALRSFQLWRPLLAWSFFSHMRWVLLLVIVPSPLSVKLGGASTS
jgi:hypothetical protein